MTHCELVFLCDKIEHSGKNKTLKVGQQQYLEISKMCFALFRVCEFVGSIS